MENLRFMLSQYNPKIALFFGKRLMMIPTTNKEMSILDQEGYMAGYYSHNLQNFAITKFRTFNFRRWLRFIKKSFDKVCKTREKN